MHPAAAAPVTSHPPERHETVVRYRPFGPVLRVLFTALFLGLCASTVVFTFYAARQVTIDCSRGDGSFLVTRTYPLFGARRQVLELDTIRGTFLQGRRGKNGVMTYALALRTDAGQEDISFHHAGLGQRQAQKRALDAFLADPGARSLHLLYDRANPWVFLILLVLVAWVYVVWTLWQQATVRFERWRGAVVLERRRPPLALWSRAFQAAEIVGARVEQSRYRGRGTYRVVLVLRTGETVPLLTVRSSSARLSEEAAEGISEALLGN